MEELCLEANPMRMKHGIFGWLPADLWYRILRHLRQEDMMALAATCHASAAVFRNPQVGKMMSCKHAVSPSMLHRY